MQSNLIVKIITTKETRIIENVPKDEKLIEVVFKLIQKFYPETDLTQIKLIQTGKILNDTINVGQLIHNSDNEAMVYIEGKIIQPENNDSMDDKEEEIDNIKTIKRNHYFHKKRKSKFLNGIILQICGNKYKNILTNNVNSNINDYDEDKTVNFYKKVQSLFILISFIVALFVSLLDTIDVKIIYAKIVNIFYLVPYLPFIYIIIIIIMYFNRIEHKDNMIFECFTTFLYILSPFWKSDKFKKKYSIEQ